MFVAAHAEDVEKVRKNGIVIEAGYTYVPASDLTTQMGKSCAWTFKVLEGAGLILSSIAEPSVMEQRTLER